MDKRESLLKLFQKAKEKVSPYLLLIAVGIVVLTFTISYSDYLYYLGWQAVWKIAELLHFLEGLRLLTLLTAIITVSIGAKIAIKRFFIQQRTARIQKIYFEDSLVAILTNVDEVLETAEACFYHIENVVNSSSDLLKNHLKVEDFEKCIREAKASITYTKVYKGYKKEMLIDLFEAEGYHLHRWLDKIELNVRTYKDLVKTFINDCGEKLKKRKTNTLNEIIKEAKELEGIKLLYIDKHLPLVRLFHKMILRIAEYNFKSNREILKQIQRDKELKKLREKFTECYKTLFGYYSAENEAVWYSYLHNKDTHNRYKIIKDERGHPVIMIQEIWRAHKEEPTIILNDCALGQLSQELYKNQLGIANEIIFEKPMFLPDKEKFFNS